MIRVYRFIKGIPTTIGYYADPWDVAMNPAKYGLEPGNYYIGRIVERYELLGVY